MLPTTVTLFGQQMTYTHPSPWVLWVAKHVVHSFAPGCCLSCHVYQQSAVRVMSILPYVIQPMRLLLAHTSITHHAMFLPAVLRCTFADRRVPPSIKRTLHPRNATAPQHKALRLWPCCPFQPASGTAVCLGRRNTEHAAAMGQDNELQSINNWRSQRSEDDGVQALWNGCHG
jgi:hypothetical protein